MTDDIGIRTFLFFIFASIYAITGELGYITFVNWRMTLVKKEDRTKFASTRNIRKRQLENRLGTRRARMETSSGRRRHGQ
mgnify:CR=1 FL=1